MARQQSSRKRRAPRVAANKEACPVSLWLVRWEKTGDLPEQRTRHEIEMVSRHDAITPALLGEANELVDDWTRPLRDGDGFLIVGLQSKQQRRLAMLTEGGAQ